jgi:hypothetical protein
MFPLVVCCNAVGREKHTFLIVGQFSFVLLCNTVLFGALQLINFPKNPLVSFVSYTLN